MSRSAVQFRSRALNFRSDIPTTLSYMGDHGQSFARTDLGVDDAKKLSLAIRTWLVEECVISEDASADCVFRGVGHRPGSNWGSATRLFPNAESFLTLRTNGVSLVGGVPGVVVYPNGANLASDCPRCGEDVGEPFWGRLQEWTEVVGDGPRPRLQCPSCDVDLSLTDCVLDSSWALSFVEVTFENWPLLSESFESEMLDRLGGNSRFVSGKR